MRYFGIYYVCTGSSRKVILTKPPQTADPVGAACSGFLYSFLWNIMDKLFPCIFPNSFQQPAAGKSPFRDTFPQTFPQAVDCLNTETNKCKDIHILLKIHNIPRSN